MTYHIVCFSPERLIVLNTCSTYSEAEAKHDDWADLYPNAWVDIYSDDDLKEANAA